MKHHLTFQPTVTAFGSVKTFQMRPSIERPLGTVVEPTDLSFKVDSTIDERGGTSSVSQSKHLSFTPLERGEYHLLLSALTPGSPRSASKCPTR